MSGENKPTDKIDLASTELKVGGVNIKGSYIVWFFAVVSTVAGGIYAAGKVWSDYEKLRDTVASIKLPDQEPLVKLIEQVRTIEEGLTNASVSLATTQGDLIRVEKELRAELARIEKDLRTVQTLVESNDVSKLQGAIATLKTSVDGVQVFTRDVQSLREAMVGVQKDMTSLKKDVDSQWSAIDSIGAGSLKGGR